MKTVTDIRRLSYADLPQVVSIERRAFPTPWSLAMFVLELSKPSGVCLAATDAAGEICGYVICSRYDTVWHLMNVAVAPEQRRRGVATDLLASLLEQLGEDARVTLEVRASNAAAIALYRRFGFVSAGIRPGYYQDNREDAVIMWRN